MKKRIIRLSLVLALMLCLSVSVFAESQLWHITDDAGILTESQNIELETYAENISQDYGVCVYVVTVNNYEDYYDSAYETAWQIYHAYELGEGADRNGVILQIFSTRARTREARLQVKSAQLQYMLPRLVGMRKNLSRQGGGSGRLSNKGAGEEKLELDRRHIEHQLAEINRQLKEVEKERSTQRSRRLRSGLPLVSLVGYTNAGKSTLMNGLLSLCPNPSDSAQDRTVLEKDMLFATLDTSVRRLHFKDNKDFLISDTVGFVSHLPHQLVQAFKSTLSEAAKADLLVQVIDVSDPNYRDMIKTTEMTLKEIGVENIPMIYAFNKADLTEAPYPEILGNQITYSAKDPASIEKLVELIKENIFKDDRIVTFKIPFSEGRYLDELNVRGTVLETNYEEDGTIVSANVSPELHSRLSRFETH